MKRLLSLVALLALGAAAPAPAQTVAYPSRVVRIVVPFPPGGAVDAVARFLAQKLGEDLGQQFIVDNKAGANGTIGSDFVAKSAPDGYTLLVNASIFVINPLILKNVPFDVVRDFTAVSQIAAGPLLIVAHPSVPAATLAEFIALVKKNPARYTFATSGLGSAGHLAEEMFKRAAGVDMLIVPYKGSGPALADVVGGQVSAMIDPILSAYPHAKGGRLKALAVTSTKRMSMAPDVPTASESGLPGFEFYSWYGLWGPAHLPREVVAKLQSEVAKAVATADLRDRLAVQGFEPVGSTPERFSAYIAEEMAKYAKIVRDANIRVE